MYILAEKKFRFLLYPCLNEEFVFLDSVFVNNFNQRSFLFTKPFKILTFSYSDDIDNFFLEMEECLRRGFWLAGYFTYEFGYLFEESLKHFLKDTNYILAWLGVFSPPLVIKPEEFLKFFSQTQDRKDNYFLENLHLNMGFEEYAASIRKIKEYLKEGQTYQVNFTLKCKFDFQGNPLEFYLDLRKNQPTSYSALINTKREFILSLSPEVFFKLKENRIFTRPMKGTFRRGRNLQEDNLYQDFLRNDIKNRAENIMIVDLLRNDLGKISKEGTVKVENLFEVEKYFTVFQMTSVIKSCLKDSVTLRDILRALFPSGSVTGAPKIRTMQIIKELEKEPRGVYTGSIGYISPEAEAQLNVAIRTILLNRGKGEMGVGGGIVYDSSEEAEFKECKIKLNFLTQKRPSFSLIETILLRRGEYFLLELHLERLKNSLTYFGINTSIEEIRKRLNELKKDFENSRRYKVRLLVDEEGSFSFEVSELKKLRPSSFKIKLSSRLMDPEDIFLYHKTTHRKVYDEERRIAEKEGFFEVVFLNKRGELTEGSITNIFLLLEEGFFTPPISSGLLGGVLREYLIRRGKVKEKVLYLKDILRARKVYLGNSLRGLVKVELGNNFFLEDFTERFKIKEINV